MGDESRPSRDGPPVSRPVGRPPVDATPVEPAVETGPRHAARPRRTPPAAAADGGMTRSEEQLRVGTERVATTRARLVKYVVTEDVQITVPIRREEIRVEQVPLDAGRRPATRGRESPGEGRGYGARDRPVGLPDEIILHTERPVVTVEVVPVERVRLRTELVEGQETVTEQVQREQIVVDQTPTPTPSAVSVSPGGRAGTGTGRGWPRPRPRRRRRARSSRPRPPSPAARPSGSTIRLSPTCSVPSPAVPTRLQPTT